MVALISREGGPKFLPWEGGVQLLISIETY